MLSNLNKKLKILGAFLKDFHISLLGETDADFFGETDADFFVD